MQVIDLLGITFPPSQRLILLVKRLGSFRTLPGKKKKCFPKTTVSAFLNSCLTKAALVLLGRSLRERFPGSQPHVGRCRLGCVARACAGRIPM